MNAAGSQLARPRLLVVAPSAYPFGGVATWLDGLVHGLRERGWPLEVALLAGAHHDVDRYLERHALGAVRRVENPGGSHEGRLRALADIIAAARAELVLAVNVGEIEDAVDRRRRAGRSGARLVTTQHALQADYFEHLAARREVVDGVIVTNRLGVELAREYSRLPPERIAYAPYGVATGDPAAPAAPDGPLRIVWAGRLDQGQKRVGDLPQICAGLERAGVSYRLEIAGAGPESGALERALARFVDAGHVHWLGEVPHERVREAVYAGRDVLLITSQWETGPIVAWEALVAGLAVVSSTYLGVGREAALRHDETALLFAIGDADGALAALARARDAELRRRLVAAGQAEVRARYSVDSSLDAWEEALAGFAARAPRSASRRPAAVAAAGRLDRWLGPPAAESVRRLFGVRHRQGSAGAEWPHVSTLASAQGADQAAFLGLAAELDRAPARAAEQTG